MREIECVRNENTGLILDEYLKKLMKEVGSSCQFYTWKNPSMNLSTPMILLVTNEYLETLREILRDRDQKIIIAMNSRKDFKMVAELKSEFGKIFGFIDISQEVEYNVPILNNYLSLNFSTKSIHLEKLASDLEKVYEFTRSELIRVKDFHDRFVKVRIDQVKGAFLTSKFMAGEKSGGEFFDIIQNENELIFIQAGSNSYLLSSMILGEIEILKEQVNANDLTKSIENFQKIIISHAEENKAELTYCIMSLNLKNLTANFMLKGQGYLYYNSELLSFDKPMKLKLKPRERLCLISEGAMKNWQELNHKNSTKKFFSENENMETKDLINEFFFEVSRNKEGTFLSYDALMVVLDINENVLYQLSE